MVDTPIVTLSLAASGVNVIALLEASSRVSAFESAATVVLPTFTLLNAFWLTSAPAAMPSSFVLSAALIAPSALFVARGTVTILFASGVSVVPLTFTP